MAGTTILGRTARRAVALLATVACVVAVAPEPAVAARPLEERFAAMVDEVRTVAGKSGMTLTDRLSKKARKHSRKMARANRLFHSSRSRQLSRRSGAAAENVGVGGSLGELLRAFLNSSAHADNLLAPWSRTGVGIVKRRGRYWITQTFRS